MSSYKRDKTQKRVKPLFAKLVDVTRLVLVAFPFLQVLFEILLGRLVRLFKGKMV